MPSIGEGTSDLALLQLLTLVVSFLEKAQSYLQHLWEPPAFGLDH